MGGICSCFVQLSPETFPKEDLNDQNSGLLTAADAELSKQKCALGKNEINMRELNPQQQLVKDKEFTTLKDCLLSSPALNTYHSSTNNGVYGDDQLVHCHVILKQNKVYPSVAEGNTDHFSNPRGSFSKQRLLNIGEVNSSSEAHVSSSLSKSHSKKIKKRVSFKLPEEADIVIYNIPEDDIYQ